MTRYAGMTEVRRSDDVPMHFRVTTLEWVFYEEDGCTER